MTRLFPISLIGAGTVDVESMASSVSRLALSHSVSPRQLIATVSDAKQPGLLNGYSEFAANTVQRIGALTGQNNLAYGSLIRFRHVLSINANDSVSPTRRWCPSCIAEDIMASNPGYDSLVWSLRSVSICLKHDTWLVETCPHCLSIQHYISYAGATRDSCVRCKGSLGMSCGPVSVSHAELWCRSEISALLIRGGDLPFEGNPVRAFLVALICSLDMSMSSTARELGFDPAVIRGLLKDTNHRPTLATVLRLSASVQQPVEFILSDPIAAAAQGRFSFAAPRRESATHFRLSLVRRQQLEGSLHLAAYGPESECPPSLASICRANGVSLGCAQYAFPRLSSRINVRRKSHAEARVKRLKSEAEQLVKWELSKLTMQERRDMSQKKFVRHLMSFSGLPKRLLANASRILFEYNGAKRQPSSKRNKPIDRYEP